MIAPFAGDAILDWYVELGTAAGMTSIPLPRRAVRAVLAHAGAASLAPGAAISWHRPARGKATAPSSSTWSERAPPAADRARPRLLADAAAEAASRAAAEEAPAGARRGRRGTARAAPGLLPSVFVLEHGRLWLVAQRGYAVVPDGIRVDSGVTGRVVRLGRAQLVRDVRSDDDYVSALPAWCPSSPFRSSSGDGRRRLERRVRARAARRRRSGLRRADGRSRRFARTLATGRTLDLPALARLFVHVGSMRDPDEIAAIGAASLPKIIPLELSQVLLWDEAGAPVELASWRARTIGAVPALPRGDRPCARSGRAHDRVPAPRRGLADTDPLVWLPLRANGEEIGALVGAAGPVARVDPVQLDTAAVLAAHVAASLDAALALRRERESAMTDPLTGVLNRRGLEERLERELAAAKERRVPMSLLVIDCDDLKEINDRAGTSSATPSCARSPAC